MRFVIHHHITSPDHYDLMIETAGREMLFTWRINRDDMDALLNGREVNAVRIQDHRNFFLDYEGELTGGKGSVKRYDGGECVSAGGNKEHMEFHLSGEIFKGSLIVDFVDGDRCCVRYQGV